MQRLLLASAIAVLPLVAAAHDRAQSGLQPPYVGPGFSNVASVSSADFAAGAPPIDFERSNVRLLSWMPLGQFGAGQDWGNDCWGYTSPSGREYAIMGLRAGTGFVDLTDPGAPVWLDTIPGPASIWRDMKVFGEYAYAVSEGASGQGPSGGGVQVFDLTQIDSGSVSIVNTILTPGTEDTHNIAIDEVSGFLYRAGGSGEGLRIYDLSNPIAPSFVGSWDDRYVHDVQVHTYTSGAFAGRQLAFCCGGLQPNGNSNPSMDIVDVTDKQNIFLVRRVFYPNVAYSHQGWLSADLQYFYLNDERDEEAGLPTTTHVIDVSDPNNAFAATFFDNGNEAVGHNLYLRDDLIFEANYRSGLRVFETSNPLAPTEIAFIDTYPQDDEAEFNGVWSVYPFFESGIVAMSDIEKGLFVVWVGDPLLDIDVVSPPVTVSPAGETLQVTIAEATAGDLVPTSAMLHYDIGAGLVSVPLSPVGGNVFEAALPAVPCGTVIDYFVSARSTNNVLWKFPDEAPTNALRTFAASALTLDLFDDAESDLGWTPGLPGDTASTGLWERGDPLGTGPQPALDNTPDPGMECWFTGQGPQGGGVGANDVDDGFTTLLSPVYDLDGAESARISYSRWYTNDGNANVDDSFVVQVTSDGTNWLTLETLTPGDPQASGGWFRASFDVESFVTLTSQVQLRFIASDTGDGSIVEAAIDDLEVLAFACTTGAGSAFCFGDGANVSCPCGNDVPAGTAAGCANSSGVGATLVSSGEPRVSADSLSFVLQGGAPISVGLLVSGDNALPMGTGVGIPAFDGLRCVGGGLVRHGTRAIDVFGDAGTWGPPGGPAGGLIAQGGFSAGQTRNFAVTYRDDSAFSCMTGINFSSAIAVTFEP